MLSSSSSSYEPVGKLDSRSAGFSRRKKALLLVAVLFVTTAAVMVLKSKNLEQDPSGVGLGRQEKMIITTYSCPAGAEQTGVDASGNCVCEKCPKGHKCAGGEAAKEPCPPGYYQDNVGQAECVKADAGFHAGPGEGSEQQVACQPGFYAPEPGGAPQCTAASKGHKVPNAQASSQMQCDPGTYQEKEGQASCDVASAGHFAGPEPGAEMQLPCEMGTFQADEGQASCDPAQAGHYVDTVGAESQRQCHVGSYTAETGRASCTLADPGHFVGQAGSDREFPCPPGHYQHCGGQEACIVCEAGTVAPNEGQTSCTKEIVYRSSDDTFTNAEAVEYCARYKMILAEPRDATQQGKATQNCPFDSTLNPGDDANECWLGLKRVPGGTNNEFAYMSDNTIATAASPPWADREPNNAGSGNENCVNLNHPTQGLWNDSPCDLKMRALCQST